jgi:tetratricopeptide (TPR) repeat protein
VWIALLAWTAIGVGWAQELPDAAAEALRRGQGLAAQAQLAYPQHFPDQPLWAAALQAGREAAAAAPDHAAPQRFLAQVYSRTNWHIRAWEAWQRFRELGGVLDAAGARQLLDTALALGVGAYDQGRGASARVYLETVVELDPDDLGSHERLARLAVERSEPLAALPHLLALGENLPADLLPVLDTARREDRFGSVAVAAFDAARSAAAARDWPTAWEQYRAASDANPTFIDAWRGAADAALALGRPADAIAALERVLILEPGDPGAAGAMAVARDQVTFGVEAQRAFQRGLDAYRAGAVATARGAFQAALAQNPRYVDAIAWLGRIAAETGDLATAVERYRSASALAPGRADVRLALAQVETRLAQAEAAAAESAAQAEAAAAEAAAQAEAARAQAAAQAAEAARAEAAAQAAAAQADELGEEEAAAEAAAQAEAEAAAQAAALAEEAAGAEAAARAEEAAAQAAAQAEAAAQAQAAAQAAAQAEAAAEAQAAAEAAAQAEAAEAEEAAQAAAAAAAAAAPAAGGPATPPPAVGQVLLADAVVEHLPSTSGGSSAFTFLAAPGLDRDLSGFLGGSVHQRLEVRSKPTDEPILYQLCLVPEDISVRPACSDANALRVNGVGRFVADQPVATLSGVGELDWRRGLTQVMLVIRHPDGTPIDDRFLGQADHVPVDPDDYYPMTVRFSAVLVAPGSDFAGWP